MVFVRTADILRLPWYCNGVTESIPGAGPLNRHHSYDRRVNAITAVTPYESDSSAPAYQAQRIAEALRPLPTQCLKPTGAGHRTSVHQAQGNHDVARHVLHSLPHPGFHSTQPLAARDAPTAHAASYHALHCSSYGVADSRTHTDPQQQTCTPRRHHCIDVHFTIETPSQQPPRPHALDHNAD